MEDFSRLAVEWSEALEDQGFHTTICSTGDDAIYFLKSKKIDLVVTDLFTEKGQSGLHVLLHISRMKDSPPPVIAVTGQTLITTKEKEDNFFLRQASSLGSTSYMQKPFPADDLVSEVKKLLKLDTA